MSEPERWRDKEWARRTVDCVKISDDDHQKLRRITAARKKHQQALETRESGDEKGEDALKVLAHSARGMKALRGKRPDLVGRDRNLDLGYLRSGKFQVS
jgi:hypothetical protein